MDVGGSREEGTTDFIASLVRSASFVGPPPVPERVCSLSPMRICRQRRARKQARMVEPAWPPCWASSLMAMLQLVRKLLKAGCSRQRSRKREPWVIRRQRSDESARRSWERSSGAQSSGEEALTWLARQRAY